ncbi:MAG TPA: hypothetical protein VHL57_12630 [Flavobacteriales bacterium]|nr:hypothetical protein [Flavobacteriales bacterium]
MRPLPTWTCKGAIKDGVAVACQETVSPMPPTLAVAITPTLKEGREEPGKRTPDDPEWQPTEFRLRCIYGHVNDYR